MKIGILEAGLLREAMADRFDPYPAMFEKFLRLARRDFEVTSVSSVRGEQPASVNDCDGWMITGSRHGVYDNLDWMPPLKRFIRELDEAEVPLIGVCFGHQIIADALGGEVVKSERGWGVGVHEYRIDRTYPWMRQAAQAARIYSFHQDQVVRLPPRAEVFMSSDFCPYAGLSYGDSIISVQGHPEFEEAYEIALLEAYGGSVVPRELADSALAAMRAGAAADSEMLANWCADFFLSRREMAAAGNG